MQNKIRHAHLVEIAHRWVLKNTSCGVAFKELSTQSSNGEQPDVIGFGSGGHSVLIECKTSRADFFADRKKPFRLFSELGMGSQRFYCCPKDLIKISDLPLGWGLIYVDEKHKARQVYKTYQGNIGERTNTQPKHLKAEHELMYSALRRLHLQGRIDEIYQNPRNS